MKNSQKSSETSKRSLSNASTVQFGYSVLGQMGALVSEPPLLFSETQYSSDMTSKIRIGYGVILSNFDL